MGEELQANTVFQGIRFGKTKEKSDTRKAGIRFADNRIQWTQVLVQNKDNIGAKRRGGKVTRSARRFQECMSSFISFDRIASSPMTNYLRLHRSNLISL